MSARKPSAAPTCIDCGEPDPGSPDGRCRDCGLDYVVASSSCRECLTWITRADWTGVTTDKQHQPGCSLAGGEEWGPRDADEVKAVRAGREAVGR